MITSYILYKNDFSVGDFEEVRRAIASKTRRVNIGIPEDGKNKWTITKRSVEIVSEELIWEGLE